MSDEKDMMLRVDEWAVSGYRLPPTIIKSTSDTAPIFVDDLRDNNDPSLDPVPRITTFEQLVSVFKLSISTELGGDRASAGDKYFRLVGFYVRSGVAAFIPKVIDENGNPLPNILIYAHWPGAPALGHTPNPDYFKDGLGVAGFTNSEGDVGFGYSGGAVIGSDGGVYAIWPSADPPGQSRQDADCALKLGWHGATDHLTPNPIFQVVMKSGATPPPIGESRLVIRDNSGTPISYVSLKPIGEDNGQGGIVLVQDGIEVGFVPAVSL